MIQSLTKARKAALTIGHEEERWPDVCHDEGEVRPSHGRLEGQKREPTRPTK